MMLLCTCTSSVRKLIAAEAKSAVGGYAKPMTAFGSRGTCSLL